MERRRRRLAAVATGRKAAGILSVEAPGRDRPRRPASRRPTVAGRAADRPGGGRPGEPILAALAHLEGHQSCAPGPSSRRGRRALRCAGGSSLPPARGAGRRGAGAAGAGRRDAAAAARRDAALCALNMWAYLAAYEMPHDDPERLDGARAGRLPDRRSTASSGSGCRPTVRLQRAFSTPGRDQPLRARAGLVPLGLVRGPARERRCTCWCGGPSGSRRPPRGCTRCSTWARSSTGRSRPRRPGMRRGTAASSDGEAPPGAADDDRVRGAVLG